MNYLPGWTTNIDEPSNGVFKVTITDSDRRFVELIDAATDETIYRAVENAFSIEKQVSKNWNFFLYDLAQLLLPKSKISIKRYDDKAFGSWFIELEDGSRTVYEGKNSLVILQRRRSSEWVDHMTINRHELTYSSFANLIHNSFE